MLPCFMLASNGSRYQLNLCCVQERTLAHAAKITINCRLNLGGRPFKTAVRFMALVAIPRYRRLMTAQVMTIAAILYFCRMVISLGFICLPWCHPASSMASLTTEFFVHRIRVSRLI